MKVRKVKDMVKVLEKKGFVQERNTNHSYFFLYKNGMKTSIYTYISFGENEYSKKLMGRVKLQIGLVDSKDADDFFDCPLTLEMYLDKLEQLGKI